MEIDNQGRRRSQRRMEQRQQRNQEENQMEIVEDPNPVVNQMDQLQLEEEQKVNDQVPQQQQQQQQQRQQPRAQFKKMNPKKFLSKIPNLKTLRDFLFNKGKFYCPSQRELTSKFCKEILSGEKKLLKLKDVVWVEEVPKWKQFSAKFVWNKIKGDQRYLKYFPSYSNCQTPTRFKNYLLNVINTVTPNLIIQAVMQIRKEREQKLVEEAPIKLTNEFAELFKSFQPISNDQRRRGLQNLSEYKTCPLCLSQIRSSKVYFKCKTHVAHQKCAQRYYASEHGRNSNYSCPMRCPK